MKDDDSVEKVVKGIFTTCIVISIVAVLIFAYYGVKIRNADVCSATSYIPFRGESLSNDTYLATAGDFVLGKTEKVGGALYYQFCFYYAINGSRTQQVSVIDEKENVLSSMVIDNLSSSDCGIISGENDDVAEASYVGVRCDSCNSSAGLFLQEDLSAAQAREILSVNGSLSLQYDNRVAFSLSGREDCRSIVKTLFLIYLIIMLLMVLVILLIRGVKILENKVDEIQR